MEFTRSQETEVVKTALNQNWDNEEIGNQAASVLGDKERVEQVRINSKSVEGKNGRLSRGSEVSVSKDVMLNDKVIEKHAAIDLTLMEVRGGTVERPVVDKEKKHAGVSVAGAFGRLYADLGSVMTNTGATGKVKKKRGRPAGSGNRVSGSNTQITRLKLGSLECADGLVMEKKSNVVLTKINFVLKIVHVGLSRIKDKSGSVPESMEFVNF